MSYKKQINNKKGKVDNPWNKTAVRASAPPKADGNASELKKSEEKFKQAHKKHVESAKKYVEHYESSSDEEEQSNKDILSSIFKGYAGEGTDIAKTQQFLENLFESKSAVCLICIGTVKKSEAIWSCKNCYSFFHLLCIQRWAKDSVSQKSISHEQQEGYYNNRGEYIPKPLLSVHWDCPKCRKEYEPIDIPRHYECFCSKELNPPNHHWLMPHSCGETCGKNLIPQCGHKCVILCHPGPCPPCPQTISVSCKCGKSPVKTIRCSQQSWTCLKTCNSKLNCGIHTCGEKCHDKNDCPPCKNKSRQKCLCGNKTKEVNCFESKWQCTKVCNKKFACNIHACTKVCHQGDCGECLLGQPRTCPCGKNKSIAPCTEQIDPCGDNCQKLLACGLHTCIQRCHPGDCGQCVELVKKTCRCGYTSKEIACYKQFTCETKCKNIRECGKHPCNRKCCDNQCPACDKICGRTLTCGKHKCQSMCHHGPCYPCNMKSSVKCRCTNTAIEVPCGREKKTSAPKCKFPCKLPSKCHHDNPHNCHQDDCPMCVQICNLKNDTTRCVHLCEAKCHDAVKIVTKDKNFKPVGPWDVPIEFVEIKRLPHPQCEVKVPVTCLGGHDTSSWPCYNSKPASCGRICNRSLKCGIHVCQLQCHPVSELQSREQDQNCVGCDSGCQVPRPQGCVHPCKKPCHLPPCTPCQFTSKTTCHCGLTQVYYKCHEFYDSSKDEKTLIEFRENILSCGQKCIKNYPCGHRCASSCHSGPCPNSEACNKKVKVTCDCKNKKVEVICGIAVSKTKVVACDDSCEQSKRLREAELLAKEKLQREQEEAANQKELEEFEKKFSKKKHKERKRQIVEEEIVSPWKMWAISGGVIVLAIISGYFILK